MGKRKKRDAAAATFDIENGVLRKVHPNGQTNIVVPATVVEIASFAFAEECTEVTSITLADSVEVLRSRCFVNLDKCSVLSIGAGLQVIEPPVFSWSNALTSIMISSSNETFSVVKRSESDYSGVLVERSTGKCVLGINATHEAEGERVVGIPESIVSIEACAFAYCKGIQKLEIDHTIESIGDFAFCGCERLEIVELPYTLTYIGKGCFFQDKVLRRIQIKEIESADIGIVSISSNAFSCCNNLATLEIAQYVESACLTIGEEIFEGSETAIVIVTNEAAVDNIREKLRGCPIAEGSASIEIWYHEMDGSRCYPTGAPTTRMYGDFFGELPPYDIKGHTFIGWEWNGEIVTSSTILKIPIEEGIIPDHINLYGTYEVSKYTVTQRRCKYQDGTVTPVSGETIVHKDIPYGTELNLDHGECQDYSFFGWYKGSLPIYMPYMFDDAADITIDAYWKDPMSIYNVTEVTVGGITGWKINYATEPPSDNKTRTLTFPTQIRRNQKTYDVIAIGDRFIAETKNRNPTWMETEVERIYFPNNLISIGEEAFQATNHERMSLQYLELPESITSIGLNAFKDWDNISRIKFPKSVLAMKVSQVLPQSFQKVSTVEFYTSLDIIPQDAFTDCSALTNTNLSQTEVSVIQANAFSGCTSLESISFPSSLRTIEDSAFSYCESLSDVSFNEGLEEIGYFAFSACSISSIRIPTSVAEIGESAFRGNSNCHEIIISDNGTDLPKLTIMAAAFYGITSMESESIRVILPKRVSQIGISSFAYISTLSYLEISADINIPHMTEEADRPLYGSMEGELPDASHVILNAHIVVGEGDNSIVSYFGNNAWASGTDWCPSRQVAKFEFASDVTKLRWNAVPEMPKVHSITIPPSVAEIDYGAFATPLTDIYFTGPCPIVSESMFFVPMAENFRFHIPSIYENTYPTSAGRLWGYPFDTLPPPSE